MADIGKNILEARKRAGLTQEELAAKVGYKTKSAINKIELGVRDLPQKKIVQFAEALGTTPGVLMGWVNEDTSKKNAAIAGVVVKLRQDEDLLHMVEKLTKISDDRKAIIKQLLDTFPAE